MDEEEQVNVEGEESKKQEEEPAAAETEEKVKDQEGKDGEKDAEMKS